MNILNIMTCYNEIEYLPYTVEFYKDAGIDLFILDNYSTDGSYEWIMDHKIPCERIDTKGTFHLEYLQKARLAIMHQLKPDWVICGDADEFIVTPNSTLKDVIFEVDRKGFNLIRCRKLEFYNTGEARKATNPKKVFFYYKEPPIGAGDIVRIHKYQAPVTYNCDSIQVSDPKVCTVEGYVLNYGGSKSKEQREDVLSRRKKAWDIGLSEDVGSHYLAYQTMGWKWQTEDLHDIRNFEPLGSFLHAT